MVKLLSISISMNLVLVISVQILLKGMLLD